MKLLLERYFESGVGGTQGARCSMISVRLLGWIVNATESRTIKVDSSRRLLFAMTGPAVESVSVGVKAAVDSPVQNH